MTRARLAALGRSLGKEDEVVIEATGNAMAVVRVLSPYVGRVIVANPLGQGDRPCARQDRQDRCRCSGVAAGRRLSARDLAARC